MSVRWRLFAAAAFCFPLTACHFQSVPDCTVAGWWAHETPQEEVDIDAAGRDDDGRNACVKYGRCTSSKGPAGGSRSASRSSSGKR